MTMVEHSKDWLTIQWLSGNVSCFNRIATYYNFYLLFRDKIDFSLICILKFFYFVTSQTKLIEIMANITGSAAFNATNLQMVNDV